MTRMTGPDCAVMCKLINIHTYEVHAYIHTHIHTDMHTYIHTCISICGKLIFPVQLTTMRLDKNNDDVWFAAGTK